MKPFHQRLFADDYAAGGQLSHVPDKRAPLTPREQDPPWRAAFLGSLRFDSILSHRLVIPDSHLLDGRFFLSARAADLRREIGRPAQGQTEGQLHLPFLFGLRRPTLEQTVAEFLRTDDDEHLNGFSFKSIPDTEARAQLAKSLKAHSWHELQRRLPAAGGPSIADAVGAFLIDLLDAEGFGQAAPGWIHPLAARWRSWLELEDEGAVEVEQYGWGTFDLRRSLAEDDAGEDDLSTELGRTALATLHVQVSSDHKLRTDANEAMARLREDAAGDEAAEEDLRRVDRIYSRARYRAIAWQHDAVFVRTAGQGGRPLGTGERVLERVRDDVHPGIGLRVELPEDICQALGEMHPETFQRYMYENRDVLRQWWRAGDLDDLKRATDRLAPLLVAPRRLPPGSLLVLVGGVLTGGATLLASQIGIGDVVTAGGTAIAGAAGTLAAQSHANAPVRHVRRRIADAVSRLDEPVMTDRPG